MIIIICGKPRVGKTALNTHFADYSLRANGRLRLQRSIAEVNSFNVTRQRKLIVPDAPPIYTNYEAQFRVGYKKYFDPLWVNPFYLGAPSSNPSQRILPYGELHITEGQRYWDSRESATLADCVSRFFETHGHFGLDIFIDVQRAKLIDLNIRALAKKIIEVQRMVHVKDAYGRIISTTWYCREFTNSQDYEAYAEGKAAPYVSTSYTHEGNVFELYNSRSCKEEFVPKESENFTILKYKNSSEVKALPQEIAQFYSMEQPAWFRAKAKKIDLGANNERLAA